MSEVLESKTFIEKYNQLLTQLEELNLTPEQLEEQIQRLEFAVEEQLASHTRKGIPVFPNDIYMLERRNLLLYILNEESYLELMLTTVTPDDYTGIFAKGINARINLSTEEIDPIFITWEEKEI